MRRVGLSGKSFRVIDSFSPPRKMRLGDEFALVPPLWRDTVAALFINVPRKDLPATPRSAEA